MISKNKEKFIISLQRKKTRDEECLYVIEGDKLVKEFLNAGIRVKTLIAKPEFLRALPGDLLKLADETEEVSYEELKHLSSLKTPHNALAVIPMPKPEYDPVKIVTDLTVMLESVQDPGNLGTIIRAAAWFGIKNIICSEDCVDIYNPKVIQASMGAILHVNVHYYNLQELLKTVNKKNVTVYGAVLDGESIYDHKLRKSGIILLGNESRGLSEELKHYVTDKIMIPSAVNKAPGIESLNVGMAASVIFSEFLRQSGQEHN